MPTMRFDYELYARFRQHKFEQKMNRYDDSKGVRVNWVLFGKFLKATNPYNFEIIDREEPSRINVQDKYKWWKRVKKEMKSLFFANSKIKFNKKYAGN